MAIAKTGAMYKSFTFDGQDSRDYGVYISGDGVFNAPERDVEMIEIPGRNGAYALDHGRFRNVEITYPAGLFGDTEADFAQGISDLRNMLCSRKGYCRLEDDYNPDEYRLAVYKSGLEVTPAQLKAGEFAITFECQPQRFLKSGETAVSVTSGDTITNPTLFESHPLLETEGTGTINLNSDPIVISNEPIGIVTLAVENTSPADDLQRTVDTSMLAIGDPITIQTGTYYSIKYTGKTEGVTAVNNLSMTGDLAGSVSYVIDGSHFMYINATFNAIDFTLGTAATYTNTITFAATIVGTGGTSTATGTITITMSYDGTDTFYFPQITAPSISLMTSKLASYRRKEIVGDSSVIPITGAMWFDLDIGEAWTEVGGAIVSVNNSVSFGAELPVMSPGANTITYDNTITSLKITPRWWRV